MQGQRQGQGRRYRMRSLDSVANAPSLGMT